MKKKITPQVIWKEIKSIGIIAIVVFAFKSSFFGTYVVPTGSMIPTIRIGDFLLVNQFAYGLRIPFTEHLEESIYLTKQTEPKRGEVIVFKYPRDTSLNFIKRVIAIPGDSVEIVDRVVYVNGKKIEMEEFDGNYLKEDMVDKFKSRDFTFYKANTAGKKHIVQLDQYPHAPYMPARIIPKGHYFVMGDNRDHSGDSREWGLVPRKYLIGKASYVWFSMVSPFSDHNFMFRFGRIGTPLN